MHDVSYLATSLRNALQVNHSQVELKNTKLVQNIVTILKNEGFIEDFKLVPLRNAEGSDKISIILKYIGKKQCLTQIQTISKPSLRVYSSAQSLPRVLNGLGIAIISTSQGVFTEKEARKRGIGGEVLCYVW